MSAIKLFGAMLMWCVCLRESGRLKWAQAGYDLVMMCYEFPSEFNRPVEKALPRRVRFWLRILEDAVQVRRRDGRVWVPVPQ